jgi:hypothetical protein
MFLVRSSYYIATLGLLSVLSGCAGKQGPVSYPVRGNVTLNGKPLAEAFIVLHRIGGDVEGNQKPIAYSSADGTFVISTLKSGDGAPPGEYAITVVLNALTTGGEEPVRNGPNTLPPKYAKPETSGLKFRVTEGENEIPGIALKG